MRYRLLQNGDTTIFSGYTVILQNTPQTVAQAVDTALQLKTGDWFLDLTAGVPYFPDILGAHTQATRDDAVQAAILAVQGVTDISSYSSSVDPVTRIFTVDADIDTVYGPASVSTQISP